MAAWNRSPGKLDQQDGGQPHPHRDQSLAGLHGSYRIRITVATSRQPSGSFYKLVRGVGNDLWPLLTLTLFGLIWLPALRFQVLTGPYLVQPALCVGGCRGGGQMVLSASIQRNPRNLLLGLISFFPNTSRLSPGKTIPNMTVLGHSGMSDSLQPQGLYSPGSSVHGIPQARILEWVAISFSRGSALKFFSGKRHPKFSGLQVLPGLFESWGPGAINQVRDI